MRVTLLIAFSVFLCGCEKQTELLSLEKAADYLPLAAGKYWVYRLDSTVVVNFGNSLEVHSYQEKHLVDAAITNDSRSGFRVLVYQRDVNGTTPWKATGSYFASAEGNVEVTENNLRFMKLANPVRAETQWKGNAFLPQEPYGALYEFSNDNDMNSWIYTYTGLGENIQLNGKDFNNVVTVLAVDDSFNFPVVLTQEFGYKSFWLEQYAKGIGLINQETVMLEYQPPNADRPGYYGFAVNRTLLEHN